MKEDSLDSTQLSIRSEIEKQQQCCNILSKPQGSQQSELYGGFKDVSILGNQQFIQFSNKSIEGASNDDNVLKDDNVFKETECFYHAVLNTLDNEKGIKFIGKNIQDFTGQDLRCVCQRKEHGKEYDYLFVVAAFLLNNFSETFEDKQQQIKYGLKMIWKSFNSKKKTIDEESKAVEGFNQKYEDST